MLAAVMFPVVESAVPEAVVKVSLEVLVVAKLDVPVTNKFPDSDSFVPEALV